VYPGRSWKLDFAGRRKKSPLTLKRFRIVSGKIWMNDKGTTHHPLSAIMKKTLIIGRCFTILEGVS
jgi:hypothetical protein